MAENVDFARYAWIKVVNFNHKFQRPDILKTKHYA